MPVLNYEGIKHGSVNNRKVKDALTVEEVLHISINGTPFTVTMRSPDHDTELVRGLLFTEDIYNDKQIEPVIKILEQNKLGFTTAVDVLIDEKLISKPYRNSRSIMSVSSCGICGKTELEPIRADKKQLNDGSRITADIIPILFKCMNESQSIFQKSGGSHAAAVFSSDGTPLSIMEDIGRHNAVDKIIGDLLINKNLKQARCLIVSGRISYEIVSKCFIAGIPVLAAVSAPSSLAVDYAKELGITLLGFCRKENFTVYSHPEKIDFGTNGYILNNKENNTCQKI